MIKIVTFSIFLLIYPFITVFCQSVPEGYLLQYQQNFNNSKALNDFRMEEPSRWGILKAGTNFYLQCSKADFTGMLPANKAVLVNRIFGDFILEADVMPLKDSLGRAEVCLFLGVRDTSKYYYVQLANLSDSITHGIFLVKNSLRTRLTEDDHKTVNWKQNQWSKVRLVRDIVRRTITVYVDNMTEPFMLVRDYELVMGSVGLGTQTGSARFDNIKIWAPTVLTEKQLSEMM